MLRMTWKLFYDGGCNLCHSSKLRVEKWAAKRGIPLDVEILQSDEGVAKGYGNAMVLETERGPLFAAEAWMEIMKIAPWYLQWLTLLTRIVFLRPLLKWGYGVVERNRFRWFGKRTCPIPNKVA